MQKIKTTCPFKEVVDFGNGPVELVCTRGPRHGDDHMCVVMFSETAKLPKEK